MEEWIKHSEESWQKEDDLSTAFVLDYWDQDSEEENHPPHSLRRAAKNRIIREAIEKNQVYDIDRLFWNGGKLFGCDTYFKKVIDYDGKERESGPWISIKDGNKNYEVRFLWNWEHCFLDITGKSEISTPLEKVPLCAQRRISFDMLFGVKPEITKLIIEKSIDEIITYFKSMEGNNNKKDNRNS